MIDKVLCPYCGAEMKLDRYDDGYAFGAAYYVCEECGSTSPTANTDAAALAAAQARYLPPNRPLTLDEVKAHCKGGASAMPLWVEFDDGISGWVRIAPKSQGCEMEYVSDFVDLMWQQYKKSWRCWLKKPTQAEMDAAGWGGGANDD